MGRACIFLRMARLSSNPAARQDGVRSDPKDSDQCQAGIPPDLGFKAFRIQGFASDLMTFKRVSLLLRLSSQFSGVLVIRCSDMAVWVGQIVAFCWELGGSSLSPTALSPNLSPEPFPEPLSRASPQPFPSLSRAFLILSHGHRALTFAEPFSSEPSSGPLPTFS